MILDSFAGDKIMDCFFADNSDVEMGILRPECSLPGYICL